MIEVKQKPREKMLEVHGLKKYFTSGGGMLQSKQKAIKAVDDLSFFIYTGETLGVVGESGCGKSTMGRTLLRLQEPTSGETIFDGQNINRLGKKKMRSLRKEMQMIFQDPYGSLNPRMTVGAMLGEIIHTHQIVPKKDTVPYIHRLLEDVGLRAEHYWRYPHEFSGGQRQRISIARALAVKPKLIVCDEAVSALDVSVQAQVLNLLQRLKRDYQLTYLFISHDLSVVKHISDRVAVMYLGQIVELADKNDLYKQPQHPYTQALLSAIPSVGTDQKRERIILKGDVPSPLNVPSGCRFHTRCPLAVEKCKTDVPAFREVAEGHFTACHLA
ncbi:MAG TPA: dipeptide ABC transporter ATP-binding protein [Bacillales bacterium]|nr:dipeptide ABC transporter ATP-binding protein [Bacillales bacterium]